MAGIKISTFLGKAPKVSPELLPNTAAQIAENCKLYSGDLIPYPQPVVVDNTGRTGTLKTLYALRNPDNSNDLKWLSWTTQVSIAVASANLQDEQRFYYTGDGSPKVSNYELATAGTAPYPTGYYDLGLPLPSDTQILTTTSATFTTKTSASYSRDTANLATIVTTTPHGLRTGNAITVSGSASLSGTYTGTLFSTVVAIFNHGLSNGDTVVLNTTSGVLPSGSYVVSSVTANTFNIPTGLGGTGTGTVEITGGPEGDKSFNATSVVCTVVDPTTLTYFNPGPEVPTQTSTSLKIDLGGLTQARSYVFTWYTPWDEESISSKPSDNLFIKEGIQVTVSDIPTVKPSGDNFVRGVGLYRTVPSLSGTEYFRLAILWFPTAVTRVQRTANVSRVTLAFPHNLSLDDRFKISACSVASFDITDGVVTGVIDDFTFEYAQTAANVASTAATAGTLFHDVAEALDKPARYWGDAGNYDFLDDFDSLNLITTLDSDEYDAPPRDLQGLVSIQNNILAGFVGNTVYFSEPAIPHAWPNSYATPVSETIVALVAIAGSLLVLTKGYPYLISVRDPASGATVDRIDALYPCLNAQSVVTMGYGVVWATNDGLAVFSPSSGSGIVTKVLYNNDTWTVDVDPNTVVAAYYGENYFASHSTGSFVFEQDTKVGGFFVDTVPVFSASWYDTYTGKLYYTTGTLGDVYEWDDLSQPALTMEWKSKVIVTKDMINVGAARVIADYSTVTTTWDQETVLWNSALTNWNNADEITFRLWVDKQLIFTTTVNDSNGFRLPTGYRTDTFEIGVEGNVRVRAIHLAETMLGLREV